MTGQELATAVQYGAGVLVLVFNNQMYGTIRMHQEREFPGREHGTALVNPDFAKLAEAYGAFGATAATTDRVCNCAVCKRWHSFASGGCPR